MSIQPASVVRRIVEDARANPRADFAWEVVAPDAFGAGARRQSVAWLRAPADRFATEFEFWAHALAAWLARAGVPERLEAVVGNALCEPVAESELRRALATRLSGVRAVGGAALAGPVTGAWRMLEQDVVASYAIATGAEMAAFFWEDLAWR